MDHLRGLVWQMLLNEGIDLSSTVIKVLLFQ